METSACRPDVVLCNTQLRSYQRELRWQQAVRVLQESYQLPEKVQAYALDSRVYYRGLYILYFTSCTVPYCTLSDQKACALSWQEVFERFALQADEAGSNIAVLLLGMPGLSVNAQDKHSTFDTFETTHPELKPRTAQPQPLQPNNKESNKSPKHPTAPQPLRTKPEIPTILKA